MPLDVHIENPNNEVLMSFDSSDGLYWYIYPFLEKVAKNTGEMIDLYSDAAFKYELLMELFLGLEEAVADIKKQPESWDIEVSKDASSGKPNYATINKKKAITKLEALMKITNDAYNDGNKLVFIGD